MDYTVDYGFRQKVLETDLPDRKWTGSEQVDGRRSWKQKYFSIFFFNATISFRTFLSAEPHISPWPLKGHVEDFSLLKLVLTLKGIDSF